MKKALKSKLPDSIVTESAYSAVRLKDKFNVKTKTLKEHNTYCVECPEENCNENYVGNYTGCRLLERVIGHNGRDKNSHIFKRCVEREQEF